MQARPLLRRVRRAAGAAHRAWTAVEPARTPSPAPEPAAAPHPAIRHVRPPLPPPGLRFMGEDDAEYLHLGDQILDLVRLHAGLAPRSRVLDIGCGYGRLPHALVRWGRFEGSYLGIDILPRHISWCAEHLGRDGYAFRHLDVHNDRYNPTGTLRTPEVRLPADDGPFDVVVMASVATHLWPEDVETYLALAAAALAPGGRLWMTFFLLDDTWRRLREQGVPAAYPVPHRPRPMIRVNDLDDPLHVVAYEHDWVVRTAAAHGLEPAGPPEYGHWSMRTYRTFLQDIVVLREAAA